MNRFWQTDYEVPYWVVALIVLTIFASLGIGFIVGNLAGILTLGAGLLRVGIGLFLVYLFYRFVVAVETIAEKH